MSTKIFLKKLSHNGIPNLEYSLSEIYLNREIGKNITITFTGEINCINCHRKIKKTFNQGYCFPCSQKLARTDLCILKPELCHYRHGTCREPQWGEANCLIPHVIYLANTAGLKVGITREHKKFERWGDQGATSAIVLAKVSERYLAGLTEVILAKSIKDKADWRALITGKSESIDLTQEKNKLIAEFPNQYKENIVSDNTIYQLNYPIKAYLEKAKTYNLDKDKIIKGEFLGIRGQYLLIGNAAINIRKYQGYWVELEF